MKYGIAFTLQWIHTVILAAGARVAAENLDWPAAGILAATVIGFIAGIVPIIRTAFLAAILFVHTNWWQAAILTCPIALALLFLESAGNSFMKR